MHKIHKIQQILRITWKETHLIPLPFSRHLCSSQENLTSSFSDFISNHSLLFPNISPPPSRPRFTESPLRRCRGARRSHPEDREGGDPDDGQRQSGGRIQRGGADRGDQEMKRGNEDKT